MPLAARTLVSRAPRRLPWLLSTALAIAALGLLPTTGGGWMARAAGGTVSGTVSGPDGGVTASSVWICPMDDQEDCFWAEAGDGGAWTSETLPDGWYRVRVAPPDGSDLRPGWYADDVEGGYVRDGTDATYLEIDGTDVAGIDVTLPVGKAIAGTITGPDGEAVATAAVWVCDVNEDCRGTTTDDTGAYRVGGLDASAFRVHIEPDRGSRYFGGWYAADADGHWGETDGDATLVDLEAGEPGPIDLRLPTGVAVTGTITGPDGLPVMGAYAYAYCLDADEEPCAYAAETGEDGVFELVPLHPGEALQVAVDAPWGSMDLGGFYRADAAGGWTLDRGDATTLTVGPDGSDGIDIRLPTGRAIRGRITGPGDVPAEGASLRACIVDRCQDAVTDVDGTYTVGPFPNGSARLAVLEAGALMPGWYAEGAPGHYRSGLLDSTPIIIAGTDREDIDMTLPLGRVIAGTITDEAGDPVVGAQIVACSANDQCGSGQTGDDGSYTTSGLTAGSYVLEITVPEDAPTIGGLYRAGVPGSYTATWETASAIEIDDVDRTGIDVVLPLGRYLVGTVTDSEGNPVLAVEVSARGENGWADGYTDDTGAFRVGPLPDGIVRLHLEADGGLAPGWYAEGAPGSFTALERDATPITVDGSDVEGLAVAMPTGATVSGTILDAHGDPVADASVQVVADVDLMEPLVTAETDGTGAFATSAVPAGDWYLRIVPEGTGRAAGGFYATEAAGHYTPDRRQADAVALGSTGVDGLDIVLPDGHAIAGRITGPDAQHAAAGASVIVCEVPTAETGPDEVRDAFCDYVQTDEDGAYTTRASLPDLDYTVSVMRPMYSRLRNGYFAEGQPGNWARRFADATPVTLSGEDRTDIDVTLREGLVIRGKVTYTDGTPVLGASAYTCSGEFQFMSLGEVGAQDTTGSGSCAYAVFDDHGNYVFAGLEKGAYMIVISGPGGIRLSAVPERASPDVQVAAAGGTWYCNGELVAYWSDACAVEVDDEDVTLETILIGQADSAAPVVTLATVNGDEVTFPFISSAPITSVGGACGTAQGDEATVSLTVDGTDASPATAACVAGAWQLELETPIDDAADHVLVAAQSDAAGHDGTSGAVTVSVDSTAPTVGTPELDPASVRAGEDVAVTATVEDANGVAAAQVRVGDAGWAAIDVADGVASATITAPDSAGTVAVCVRAMDGPGTRSDGTACTDLEVTPADAVAPEVELHAGGVATRATVVTWSIEVSEPVTGLEAGDLALGGTATGCVLGEVQGSGDAFTVDVTGCSEGTLALTLAAGAVEDAAANPGPADDVTGSVLVDRTAPSVGTATVKLRADDALAGNRIPVRVRWTASDDAGSGVDTVEVARSDDGGRTWGEAVGAGRSAWDGRSAPGSAVRYRVRAVDAAGNTGAWLETATIDLRLHQAGCGSATCRGTWKVDRDDAYSGGSAAYSRASGASMTVTVQARSVALVTTLGPGRGRVRIFVDDEAPVTVDLGGDATQDRAVAWMASWGRVGTHTLRFVVLGTSGRPRVDLDALAILR